MLLTPCPVLMVAARSSLLLLGFRHVLSTPRLSTTERRSCSS
jgi:hypothetical protein